VTLANPAAEGGIMGKKWPRNFAESGYLHVTFGFFYMPLSTTWDRRLYFPSEGKRAEDFFARKIRRLRPGFNLQTWVFVDFTKCYLHIPAPAIRYFNKRDFPLFFKEISVYKIVPSVAKKVLDIYKDGKREGVFNTL
jgi:hypothetical protein